MCIHQPDHCAHHWIQISSTLPQQEQSHMDSEHLPTRDPSTGPDQLQPSHVPIVIGTATPELVFTATTDAAQWVQIYGLLRPTDANE